MPEIQLKDAQKRLSELIDKASNGEEIVIMRSDGTAFKIVPLGQSKPYPKYGSAQGQIEMSDDFDELLEDFKEYMP